MFHAVSKDACLSSEGTRSTGTDSVTPFSASQPCPRAGCYHRNFLLFLLLLFSVQCNCLEHNQLLVPRDVRPQHVIPHTSVLVKQTAMAGEGFPLSSMRIRKQLRGGLPRGSAKNGSTAMAGRDNIAMRTAMPPPCPPVPHGSCAAAGPTEAGAEASSTKLNVINSRLGRLQAAATAVPRELPAPAPGSGDGGCP